MHTLLVIDDDPDVLAALRRSFRKNYAVLTAESGDTGIAILKERTVDLIICDQRMPGTSGTEVLQTALRIQPNAVRILLTASYMESQFSPVNGSDIDRYITKPWEPEELDSLIAQALKAYDLKHRTDKTPLLSAHIYQSLENKLAGFIPCCPEAGRATP